METIKSKIYDVIIIGGSYAGLSAAMSLGRSLRSVLIIDNDLPCNKQTPHSHNFLTQDGQKPNVIASKGKDQLSKYSTVQFYEGLAVQAHRIENKFSILTERGDVFSASKLIFATGIKDLLPEIDGFSSCWGITAIHCPYCHGYEFRNERTAIMANSDVAFHFAQLIGNLTKNLLILSNGQADFTSSQLEKLNSNNIEIIEKEIASIHHNKGEIFELKFLDGTTTKLKALYHRPKFRQHCEIPENIGCELTELGYLRVDAMQKTNIEGVYACGDNTNAMRSVANAVSTGSMAGAAVNMALAMENF